MLRQHRHIDEQAAARRRPWTKRARWLVVSALAILGAMAAGLYCFADARLAYAGIPAAGFLALAVYYRRRSKMTRIYHYRYSQLFPFKVLLNDGLPQGLYPYLHAKIYVVDDRIAYLGSLNFTKSGARSNYEKRIRTTDAHAVSRLRDEIRDLFDNPPAPEVDMAAWGRALYPEPIN